MVFGSPSLSEQYLGDERSGVPQETFTESQLYSEVTTFDEVSEWQLLTDNNPTLLEQLENVPGYDVNVMQNYKYKMYEKRYREWDSAKCSYVSKQTGEERVINPGTL